MQSGQTTQRRAFRALSELGILRDLARYRPVLCGTVPISIDVEGSDLDIIMEVYEPERFKRDVHALYGMQEAFVYKEKQIRQIPSQKANFSFDGFAFELFAQPIPVERQHAYLHMLVEHHLLLRHPDIRTKIINLKKQGIKTEPAFAQVLGLTGDPYEALLVLGQELGVIAAGL
ncbi:DUF4269 domain-containing protein [Paenibacillus hodogayensis]